MTIPVHYLHPPEASLLAYLRERLDGAIRLSSSDGEAIPGDTQILVAGRPKKEHLAACSALTSLIIPWSGLPDVTRELMLEHPDIAVHNLHHNALPVAELAFTLLLAAAKFIVPLDRSLRKHDWTPRYQPNPSVLLRGKTALIVGYGAIGRQLAPLCKALGMRVIAVRRSQDASLDDQLDEIQAIDALPGLLPRAEALLLCLPLTPETEGIIGPGELQALPRGAVLVNIGRGHLVDEEALYEALRERHLLAAGLDVWYNYPSSEDERAHTLPSHYPFHELDNVVMSPHRGGATRETGALRMDGLAELLNAAARGEAMPNQVDIAAGY